jgi:hypothetical protein
MIWPVKVGSVLLSKNAAEANNQGVRRGAGETEATRYYSHLGIDDYEQLLTRDENFQADYHFSHANPLYTSPPAR